LSAQRKLAPIIVDASDDEPRAIFLSNEPDVTTLFQNKGSEYSE